MPPQKLDKVFDDDRDHSIVLIEENQWNYFLLVSSQHTDGVE